MRLSLARKGYRLVSRRHFFNDTLHVRSNLRRGDEDKLNKRFELGRELGTGRFGMVRLGQDRDSGEHVAIKTIPKSRSDPKALRNEVELLERLKEAPHCMQMLSWFEDNHNLHIVTELYSGGELFDRILDEGFFSERRAARYARQILEAIKACHENGVIHRDLKPENLLLTSEDRESELVLIDFGIAEQFQVGDKFSNVCGSPTYVAPEASLFSGVGDTMTDFA